MSKSFEDIYRGINYDLINHYNQGVSDERNRIIKLLEKTVDVYLSDKLLVEAAIVANNIALIKGEPNDNNG